MINLWAKVKFQCAKNYPASAMAGQQQPEADILAQAVQGYGYAKDPYSGVVR